MLANKMDSTHAIEDLNDKMNSEIQHGFDSCTDGKLFVYENAINKGHIKQESCNTEDEPGSIYNYINIKPEIIDPTVAGQETGHMTNCATDKMCVNEIGTSGYMQEELCDVQSKHGSIRNYLSMKDENIDDLTIAQETKFITDSTDDRVHVYETLTSCAYIKQEPCDTNDKSGSIHDYSGIKDENIDDLKFIVLEETEIIGDPAVAVQESDCIASINYLTCCERCGEEFDLYCLKCPMLIRILNSNNPRDNRVRQTLPKNFVDICKTPSSGVGVVALRVIPKGVTFGPFEGLDSTKDDTVSKWKLQNNDLVYTKDPKRLNWMQYIRKADGNSLRNLTPFQYEDRLYYRSDCNISAGDELLVWWDSDGEENGIQDMGNSYWKPCVGERLDDTYACTFCCVGYKSICYLAAHNSKCPEKRDGKDFCKEIVQCAFCKIYVDEKEYSDYHVDRCCKSNKETYMAVPRSPEDTNKSELKDGYKCSMCAYSTPHKGVFRRHQQSHTDLRMYKCPVCPHRARIKCDLRKHVRRHSKCRRSRFQCRLCGERFARAVLFAMHQKNEHSLSAYKCDKCIFETTDAKDIHRHLATHQDAKPYSCNACGKQFQTKDSLLVHIKVLHSEAKKKYKCLKCDFETIHQGSVKRHLLTAHSSIKRFKCSRCPFKTSQRRTFDRHLRHHKDEIPLKCENCDLEFGEVQSFVRHKKKAHKNANKSTKNNDDKPFACPFCSFKAKKNWTLKQHIVIHDDDKPFACTLCPYKTRTNWYLKQHMVIHYDDKPFACALCPYKTKTNKNLKRHVVIHDEDKSFACSLCTYKTKKNTNLKRHLAVHNDDKSFACVLCSYKTKTKFLLKRHVAIHNEDQPFACAQCSYVTSTNWQLKQHIASHSDDKPFKCDVCPKMFKRKTTLTKHVQTVHSNAGKREYKCSQCPFETNYLVNIKRHEKSHDQSELFRCSECDFSTYYKRNFNRHRIQHARIKRHACHVCSFRTNDEGELDEHLKTHDLVKPS